MMTRRRAFTLVELLVATTVTLLLILALAQAFGVVGETIRRNRATLEMSGQLRGVAMRLRKDLDGVTVPMIPGPAMGSNVGYFEYYDGARSDSDSDGDLIANDIDTDDADVAGAPDVANTAKGDLDDCFMFTCRSIDEEFRGRYAGGILQSSYAEVAWWVTQADANQDGVIGQAGELYNVHRRALLVRPDLNGSVGYVTRLPYPSYSKATYDIGSTSDMSQLNTDLSTFMNDNDLSVHFVRVTNGNDLNIYIVANSLSDLTLRQNRFGHDIVVLGTTYIPSPSAPYDLVSWFSSASLAGRVLTGAHFGEDVMLSNVLALDIRVLDPTAQLWTTNGTDKEWGIKGVDDDGDGTVDNTPEAGWSGSDDEVVGPGDLGYRSTLTDSSGSAVAPVLAMMGAFVDLNYLQKYKAGSSPVSSSVFSGSGGAMAGAANVSVNGPVYDTWAIDYERDGINQNSGVNTSVDEGTDGFDNDSVNGVDDVGERETVAPYYAALRSIQVGIRMLDLDSRQVRHTTVVKDFVPE